MKQFDTIILGQGLAGSILAYRLIQSGQSVVVLDNNHFGSSSKVAAGTINPITGYRLITNSLFTPQQQQAFQLYREYETLFKQKLLIHFKQFRQLKSAEQASFWQKCSAHSLSLDYAGRHFHNFAPFIDNAWGTVEIKQTARVFVEPLLHCLKAWLIEKSAYKNVRLDYHAIKISENSVNIESIPNLKAQRIIFCEGYQAIHNPWWSHLPFKLSKGEILRVELDQAIDSMLSWRQWLIPESANSMPHALLGANYQWGDFSSPQALNPSQTAREFLLSRLTSSTTLTAKVLSQRVGIRPTSSHRDPFVGRHLQYPNVYCFNGFGSKGCLTIPYYSALLMEYLQTGKPLPSTVSRWL